jgi:methionine-rich copper-binding protein CopC/uncharacterized protein YcnI
MPPTRPRGRRLGRAAVVLAVTLAGVLLGAGTALAHVTVNPNTAIAGTYTKLTFRVPTESATAGTVSLTVSLPTDHPFPSVAVMPVPGWTVKAVKQTLPTPVPEGKLTVTEAVTSVTWTADDHLGVGPGEFQEFSLSVGPVPDVGQLIMPATQTYSDGSVVQWKDVAAPGQPEPDHPAPVLTITTASGGSSGSTGTDDAARVLAVIGIVTAALALLVAALGLRKRARRAGLPGTGKGGPTDGPTDGGRSTGRERRAGGGRSTERGLRRRRRPAGAQPGGGIGPVTAVERHRRRSRPGASSDVADPSGRGRTRSRLGRRVAVVVVSVLIGILAGAGVAAAHNVLTGSNPANGSTVDKAPSTVTLTFDQPIQNIDPVLVVTGPNGNVFTDGPPAIDGNVISAPVAAGPAGLYHAAYRIVSADGHPVTGEITFTLAGSAAGTATGSAPAAGAVPDAGSGSASTTSSGGLGGWLWLGLGVAAVLVVIAVAIALRRPRDGDG